MNTVLKTRLVRMGNSQGIRIPKLLIDQIGLSGEIEVEVQADHLVIRPTHPARQNWEAQFQSMAARGDDRLLDPAAALAPTEWEKEGWEW